MEMEHGKTWGYTALIIGLATILLYTYNGIYAFMGVLIGFLGFVLMAAIYINLYAQYEILYKKEEERKVAKKVKLAKFKSTMPKTRKDSDKHGEQETNRST
jgi:lipopolysaccharide/colanic/teichoic acid biosynthesis glycosyltransferase